MNSVLVSAIHKSSGKTTVTVGIAAALTRRGVDVQTFKKGPDYIDPMWLSQASDKPCRNLDFHFMTHDEILGEFVSHGHDNNLCIVEGNKGLYDGVDVDGTDSNAALAELLATPVVLVVDTRGMTRGIAPLVQGYCQFNDKIRIAAVILNQVGGPRHEGKLRAALEHYTDIPVIGSISRHPEIEIAERHLGLIPANEARAADKKIEAIADIIESSVDIGLFGTVACTANTPERAENCAPRNISTEQSCDIRIGIARDAAFGFYYPGDLEAFRRVGAELVPFDTINDSQLPEIDGLFIGGGFPETLAESLSANEALRTSIRTALENGLPAYAECAGLMYLSRSLEWQGQRHDMVGFIPGDAVMHDKPVGRGYMELKETNAMPWPAQSTPSSGNYMPAHEFHYASLEKLPDGLNYAYEVRRGAGISSGMDGIVLGNVVAGFSHHYNQERDSWVERFVGYVRAVHAGQKQNASIRAV